MLSFILSAFLAILANIAFLFTPVDYHWSEATFILYFLRLTVWQVTSSFLSCIGVAKFFSSLCAFAAWATASSTHTNQAAASFGASKHVMQCDDYASAGSARSYELAFDETIADSDDETFVELGDNEIYVDGFDDYSDTDVDYSGDDMDIIDTTAMTAKPILATSTNHDELACYYPGVDMGKVLAERTSFFCWTDTIFIQQLHNVYAALPIQGRRAGRWTALLLDSLYRYHDKTFAAAQTMSERLLVLNRHDGLTSPELRQVLDTVHSL
ncbi:hypothetical protein GGI09_001156 [Coemansia sp. S100]|nr:hypothetical protein GGI09_001156 [Coemansia sp. S100]